jgi:hypothetical protein
MERPMNVRQPPELVSRQGHDQREERDRKARMATQSMDDLTVELGSQPGENG